MSAPSLAGNSSAYVCDTLPPPRLAGDKSCSRSPSPSPVSPSAITTFDPPIIASSQEPPALSPMESSTVKDEDAKQADSGAAPTQPPARKLCVRHQRMADEGTNLKLQQALDALPVAEREAVSVIWSNFSSSPHPRRALILHGLLTMCCFSQLSLLTEQLAHLIRIDPFAILPREVSLKILGYLDATSLCRAAQVSRQWRGLADDDILWRGICEQHIGQKCLKCGWGLPILEKRRAVRLPTASPCPEPVAVPQSSSQGPSSQGSSSQASSASSHSHLKRRLDAHAAGASTTKKARLETPEHGSRPATPSSSQNTTLSISSTEDPVASGSTSPNPLLAPSSRAPAVDFRTRPWKDVYCERLTIERNWRRGRCTVRTLKGHTDGVMCLQFSETLSHPSFPILITGSYDRTARVWNLETGTEVQCLSGHTRAIRALQFDEAKLITGSMDHTMRVWNWRTGQCLKVLEGHTEGVVCLRYDSNVLASGSVDTTVKVWNFRTGECFTLRGHCDWVNAVQLWDSTGTSSSCDTSLTAFENTPTSYAGSAPHIDPGKMLFSASDDGTIRLWDLCARACVRQFKGHVGQVQSLKLLMVDEGCESSAGSEGSSDREASVEPQESCSSSPSASSSPLPSSPVPTSSSTRPVPALSRQNTRERSSRQKPVLISGSLDNTIKIWDIDTGKVQRTLFGHIEGVWAVASDKLRLVSGSHDRTIKVWNREEGACTATLVGHRGAVTCLALGEDKIVSGSDDGDIRLWSFGG
ncbi:WD40 repeat-like protein [Dichomitus squalens LYAD-421 SS1]|uniref:WD40 repeat-like protein n=1 Tax=Dichomitus squalens (strain LYAD-421) TaxID=732165 RepID=UPI000441238F|nr:WD40 repeat-like protein [Dichomitus squalens LYAD-421 SS1]EJF62552.1 WD40 repeat-like protein [Dichomitus squalens LYAD-421 SS1]